GELALPCDGAGAAGRQRGGLPGARPPRDLHVPPLGVRPGASADGGARSADAPGALRGAARRRGPVRGMARRGPMRRAGRRAPAAAGRMTEAKRPAFLFPGQLAETIGIGRDFFESDADARLRFERTSELCGRDLERILFSGPEAELHENLAAQAGVFLVSTLAADRLAARGLAPSASAG